MKKENTTKPATEQEKTLKQDDHHESPRTDIQAGDVQKQAKAIDYDEAEETEMEPAALVLRRYEEYMPLLPDRTQKQIDDKPIEYEQLSGAIKSEMDGYGPSDYFIDYCLAELLTLIGHERLFHKAHKYSGLGTPIFVQNEIQMSFLDEANLQEDRTLLTEKAAQELLSRLKNADPTYYHLLLSATVMMLNIEIGVGYCGDYELIPHLLMEETKDPNNYVNTIIVTSTLSDYYVMDPSVWTESEWQDFKNQKMLLSGSLRNPFKNLTDEIQALFPIGAFQFVGYSCTEKGYLLTCRLAKPGFMYTLREIERFFKNRVRANVTIYPVFEIKDQEAQQKRVK